MVITEGFCCMCPWVGLWAVFQLRVRVLSDVWVKQSKASSPPAVDLTMQEAELGGGLAQFESKASSHLLQIESCGVPQGWFCKLITNLELNPMGKKDSWPHQISTPTLFIAAHVLYNLITNWGYFLKSAAPGGLWRWLPSITAHLFSLLKCNSLPGWT